MYLETIHRTNNRHRTRITDHNAILNLWQKGKPSKEIAALTKTTDTYVRALVSRYRLKGDRRAIRRVRGYEP